MIMYVARAKKHLLEIASQLAELQQVPKDANRKKPEQWPQSEPETPPS